MKCENAREIYQSLLDGEAHPNESQAHEHFAECAGCRTWKKSMDELLCASSVVSIELPNLDLSNAVMARLPQRHPASMPSSDRKQVLAFSAICWIIGIAFITAALGAWLYITGASFGSLPNIAHSSLNSFNSFAIVITTSLVAVFRHLAALAVMALLKLFELAIRAKLLFVLSFAIDTTLILIGCIIWQRRKISNRFWSLI